MKHSFHAHHAPVAGGGSFLLGLNGAPGGFVSGPTDEARQDVFIGYRYAGEPWTLLPFVREPTAGVAVGGIALLPHGRYGRTLGWASDRWMAQALVFSIATPFETWSETAPVDPARAGVLRTPAAYALLDFDNSHMDVPVELVFALRGDDGDRWQAVGREGHAEAAFGFVDQAGTVGFAARGGPHVQAFADADRLGLRATGLVFSIPPAGKALFPIILAFGAGEPSLFEKALGQFAPARSIAQERDEELRASGLAEDVRRQISLLTRSLLAGSRAGARSHDLRIPTLRAALSMQ